MEFTCGMSSFLSEFYTYAVTAGVGYLGVRFVQAYERRAIRAELYHALTERVRTVEDTLDHVEDRVDRSDEVQHFTTSILAARLSNSQWTSRTPDLDPNAR